MIRGAKAADLYEKIRALLTDFLETTGTTNQGLTAVKGQLHRFSFTADVALL
jgi:hypothetical protein